MSEKAPQVSFVVGNPQCLPIRWGEVPGAQRSARGVVTSSMEPPELSVSAAAGGGVEGARRDGGECTCLGAMRSTAGGLLSLTHLLSAVKHYSFYNRSQLARRRRIYWVYLPRTQLCSFSFALVV